MAKTGLWTRATALALLLALTLPASRALAAEAGDYAPQHLAETADRLGWLCMIPPFCPVADKELRLIKRALEKDPAATYLLGLTLLTGDGLPGDRDAGKAWIARAAELGDPDAARDIRGRLRNGESIEVDETKVAEALKPQVAAGSVEAMRALGPMYMAGRGVKQDPAAGLALLRQAVEKGSAAAEDDLAHLYLLGGPGVPADRQEALKWFSVSANHGNVEAMSTLGHMSLTTPIGVPSTARDVAQGYCWLVRAALLQDAEAAEKLSFTFAQGEATDTQGNSVPIDLIQADLWFRVGARSPFHDNPQIRAMIEPKMTTDQLAEAKRLFAAWQGSTMPALKSVPIPLPTPAGAPARLCPAMT